MAGPEVRAGVDEALVEAAVEAVVRAVAEAIVEAVFAPVATKLQDIIKRRAWDAALATFVAGSEGRTRLGCLWSTEEEKRG